MASVHRDALAKMEPPELETPAVPIYLFLLPRDRKGRHLSGSRSSVGGNYTGDILA
jgi:hypothetical protein